VRYDQVNAMLLNEFLKEHRKVEKLQTAIVQQKKSFEANLAKQQKQIETLASGLQKVNARFVTAKSAAGKLGMSKSGAKFTLNSRETDNIRKEN
jgi:peptidoglycan hydrolase CwlO-like protein